MSKNAKDWLIFLVVFAVCGFLVWFFAFRETAPEGFTDDEFEKSKKVIELIDEFLDAEITAADAATKIELLADQLSESEETTVSLIGAYASNAAREIAKYAIDVDKERLKEVEEYKVKIEECLE